ncbi:MAG: FmdE family protein [Firmicutes bacterium]|nr:FmdE family protein [Bacillota bacterium]
MSLSQETFITPNELEAAQYFHGHKCPAMPQGLRAAHAAMDILGVQRARGGGELIAIVETGYHHFSGCFVDGVQFATGCTIGKGNLIQQPLGKFALTLLVPSTRHAVRVSAKASRMTQCLKLDFFKLRAQGVPPYQLDPAVITPLIDEVMTLPTSDLFDIQEFADYPYQPAPEVFDAVTCARCGELVVSSYAQESAGKFYCPVCLEAMLHSASS